MGQDDSGPIDTKGPESSCWLGTPASLQQSVQLLKSNTKAMETLWSEQPGRSGSILQIKGHFCDADNIAALMVKIFHQICLRTEFTFCLVHLSSRNASCHLWEYLTRRTKGTCNCRLTAILINKTSEQWARVLIASKGLWNQILSSMGLWKAKNLHPCFHLNLVPTSCPALSSVCSEMSLNKICPFNTALQGSALLNANCRIPTLCQPASREILKHVWQQRQIAAHTQPIPQSSLSLHCPACALLLRVSTVKISAVHTSRPPVADQWWHTISCIVS